MGFVLGKKNIFYYLMFITPMQQLGVVFAKFYMGKWEITFSLKFQQKKCKKNFFTLISTIYNQDIGTFLFVAYL